VTFRRRWLLVVVAAILLVLVLAGCRLTADQDPRPIPSEQVPSDLVDPATTTMPSSSATTAQARPGSPSPSTSASRRLAQSATGSSATRS
jgi:hypothetical protein